MSITIMRRSVIILFCLAIISCGDEKKQEPKDDAAMQDHKDHTEAKSDTVAKTKSLSPHTSAMAMIDDAHIHIDYSSPGVRDRIIFGGLVGYNTVWQAGAHKATWIETDKDLLINGKTLPAGKYGFFVVPGKETWKVMFNSRWDQHGKDQYNETENVLELEVKPQVLDEVQESLVYKIEERGENNGIISLAWEKAKIEVPFQVVKK